MRIKGYSVVIEPLSEEDGGGYLASVPELPGCSSDGETVTEAKAGLSEAIDGWIAMAHKLGQKVPKPQFADA